MAATKYSLRYLANRMYGNTGEVFTPAYERVESNLEKAGRSMRYALKTVQYYSPTYPYYVSRTDNQPYIHELMIDDKFDNGDYGK